MRTGKPTKQELLRLVGDYEDKAQDEEAKAVGVADGYYKVYCGNCGPPGFWPAIVERETAVYVFFAGVCGKTYRVPKQQLLRNGQYFHPTTSTRYHTAEHVREWHRRQAAQYRQKAQKQFEDACMMEL